MSTRENIRLIASVFDDVVLLLGDFIGVEAKEGHDSGCRDGSRGGSRSRSDSRSRGASSRASIAVSKYQSPKSRSGSLKNGATASTIRGLSRSQSRRRYRRHPDRGMQVRVSPKARHIISRLVLVQQGRSVRTWLTSTVELCYKTKFIQNQDENSVITTITKVDKIIKYQKTGKCELFTQKKYKILYLLFTTVLQKVFMT